MDQSFRDLKELVESQNSKVLKNRATEREILFWQRDLQGAPFFFDFSISLALLNEDLASTKFAGGDFFFKDYDLSFEKNNNAVPAFYLTNRIHNNKKMALKMPEIYQKSLIPLLSEFAARYSQALIEKTKETKLQ